VLTRPAALELINAKVKVCTRCPDLCESRRQTVFGEGNPAADVVFIGEGPGENEDKTGRPFVGDAGSFLNKIIKACGWHREDVYIMNVVRCRPPGNRVPTQEEADNCKSFLKLQIRVVQPKVIVCLGATASKHMLGFDARMSSYRGEWYDYKDGPVDAKVRCTYHPSYVLHIATEEVVRKKEAKDAIWEDMQAVIKELKYVTSPRSA